MENFFFCAVYREKYIPQIESMDGLHILLTETLKVLLTITFLKVTIEKSDVLKNSIL